MVVVSCWRFNIFQEEEEEGEEEGKKERWRRRRRLVAWLVEVCVMFVPIVRAHVFYAIKLGERFPY